MGARRRTGGERKEGGRLWTESGGPRRGRANWFVWIQPVLGGDTARKTPGEQNRPERHNKKHKSIDGDEVKTNG